MKTDNLLNKMIERQIIARGISNKRLMDAFLKVPRHLFVPENLKDRSYEDNPLEIGYGQTISQPYIVALMTDLLDVDKSHTVLEIGTGSGYQTALLAELAGKVYTIERIPELLASARDLLDSLGYENVFYHTGDGTKGWQGAFPVIEAFDRIIVSAAAPHLPDSLLKQLHEGGKLVIPTGSRWIQELLLITKQDGKMITRKEGGCRFVPLIGEEGWEA